MKVIIIGAGRMGQRHGVGAASSSIVSKVKFLDISTDALMTASENLKSVQGHEKISFGLLNDSNEEKNTYNIAIFAATAANRIQTCKEIIERYSPSHVLIEKPLGQSFAEVEKLHEFFSKQKLTASVNLNMRIYDCFIQLKKDIATYPQFKGDKVITLNTGSIGISANGIHYLDLFYFILGADNAEIISAEVEPNLIPSGRGPQFSDFGGWCTIKFYKQEKYIGRVHLSITAQSTVFGGWDIVGPHGRITINEIPGTRTDVLRKEDSIMPLNRYAADYLAPVENPLNTPAFLGDLTKMWIEELNNNKNILPELKESLKAHKLMFDWLSHSKTHQKVFPIT